MLAIALLAVCSSFAPVLPARFDSFHTFVSPCGSTVHGNVKHSSNLYSHMPSTRPSHLITRSLPRQVAKTAKSRRTTSSIRIEEAAQIAGERAGQIKSNSKLRRATKADLEANSLQDMQHLLRKMAKTFFLARCVLSEDGTREWNIIPCSGIEAPASFSFLFYEPGLTCFL